jgi:hypothetical protein
MSRCCARKSAVAVGCWLGYLTEFFLSHPHPPLCLQAVTIDDNFLEGHMRCGEAHMGAENWEEAVGATPCPLPHSLTPLPSPNSALTAAIVLHPVPWLCGVFALLAIVDAVLYLCCAHARTFHVMCV